jgi:uncharacterized membrane protein
MVGEEYGWIPLDGWAITLKLLGMAVLIIVPGFLLSLALFPKRTAMAMSERLALSFGLGLAAPFLLMLLNMILGVPVNLPTSAIVFVFVCVIGMLGFLNRGGDINLAEWYKSIDS